MIKISRPTLVVDKERVINNIQNMARKAGQNGVRFRPHFKTHMSAEIGKWFRDLGIRQITVSSVEMANYFADSGWQDITLAFLVNPLQIEEINSLSQRVYLHLLVDSEATIPLLRRSLSHRTGLWIKVNTGYNRTGVSSSDLKAITAIANACKKSPNLEFHGILTHSGHSYNACSIQELDNIYRDTTDKMVAIKEKLLHVGFPEIEISYGDTPTCSVVQDFSALDEIRPGNFVFYDLMQLHLKTCREKNLAAGLACPVVATYPQRQEIVVYGGATHLSKEHLIIENKKMYGAVALPAQPWGDFIKGAYVSSLSQEHGIIHADPSFVSHTQPGDILFILPVHSCLTANLQCHYLTTQGQILPNIHSCDAGSSTK